MSTTIRRTRRQATPERWQAVLRRAFAEGLQVRQLAGSGAWIATSGTDAAVAYGTDSTDCDCPAAMLGADPVCKHRTAYWNALGALDLDPEPDPPPPVVAVTAIIVRRAVCAWCEGEGYVVKRNSINPEQTYKAPVPAPLPAAGAATGGVTRLSHGRRIANRRPLPPNHERSPEMQHPIGRGGHVAGYDLFFRGDSVVVTRDRDLSAPQAVPTTATPSPTWLPAPASLSGGAGSRTAPRCSISTPGATTTSATP